MERTTAIWMITRRAKEKRSEKGMRRPLARVPHPLFGWNAHNHLLAVHRAGAPAGVPEGIVSINQALPTF
jgi:hypothetical protein